MASLSKFSKKAGTIINEVGGSYFNAERRVWILNQWKVDEIIEKFKKQPNIIVKIDTEPAKNNTQVQISIELKSNNVIVKILGYSEEAYKVLKQGGGAKFDFVDKIWIL